VFRWLSSRFVWGTVDKLHSPAAFISGVKKGLWLILWLKLWLRIYAIEWTFGTGFFISWTLQLCFEFLLFLFKLLLVSIMDCTSNYFVFVAAAFFNFSWDVLSSLRDKIFSVAPNESLREPVLGRDWDLLMGLLSNPEACLASHMRPLSVAFLFLKTWCQNSDAKMKKCTEIIWKSWISLSNLPQAHSGPELFFWLLSLDDISFRFYFGLI